MSSTTTTTTTYSDELVAGVSNPQYKFTSLRVPDTADSVAWYCKHLGFQHVAQIVVSPTMTVDFVATVPDGATVPSTPNSPEAHEWLMSAGSGDMVMLAFKHDKTLEHTTFHNGNEKGNRGFGHVAVNVDDVYATCAELEAAGVSFQKKPDEGNMKGLAFALDNNGYWVEIVRRGAASGAPPNFSQTMLRITDPGVSLPFYSQVMGLTLVAEKHFPQWSFSLYFLAHLSDEEKAMLGDDFSPADDAAFDVMKNLWSPVVELTHNHGSDEVYHKGAANEHAFSQLNFVVDDVAAAIAALESAGFTITVPPTEFPFGTLAFFNDPDGYPVELFGRKQASSS